MNIINIMRLQLSEIKRIIITEIEENEFTYNYLICEKECSFLDINKLQIYLTEQNINKTVFFKKINILCTEIISLWNNELQKIPYKKIKEPFYHIRYKNSLDFYAIYLTTDCKFSEYNSIQGKIEFLNKYDFSLISVAKIAHRCTRILNYITATYPETSNISGNKTYKHYILNEFFGFSDTDINQEYTLEEYESFYNKISSKFIEYKSIFEKLPQEMKIKFKNDYCDQLKQLKSKQILNKFIEVLNAAINNIDNHYLISDSKYDKLPEISKSEININNYKNHITYLDVTQSNFEVKQSNFEKPKKLDKTQSNFFEIDNEDKHPKHDPNLWDKKCYNLFKYLFDNYYDNQKRTKRKLTNMWFYLKEYNPEKYTLKATKKNYKDFISNNYRVVITNDQKAKQKYDDKEYPTMNDHRQQYEDGLK